MRLLADPVFVWGFGVFFLGVLAFFFFVFATIARVFMSVIRAIFGLRMPVGGHTGAGRANTHRACPNVQCGYLNPWNAQYCARCGSSLSRMDGQ